ncbi:MAG: PaaI family thioesterase [Archaeoglobaceae archaeon]
MDEKLLQFLQGDNFRQHLGVDIVEVREGYASVKGRVKEEFTNFHNTVHGSFLIAMADFALGIAANSDNVKRFAVTIKMDFYKPAYSGDVLTAESEKIYGGWRVGFYRTRVFKGEELIAQGDAVSYGKGEIIKD